MGKTESIEDKLILCFNRKSQAKSIAKRDILGTAFIFELSDALSSAECKALVSTVEQIGFTSSFQKQTRDMAFRRNGRLQVQSDRIAQLLHNRLKHHLPERIDKQSYSHLNPNIRFYKYSSSDRFGRHIDESVQIGQSKSLFTVLIYLNQSTRDVPLKGGETVFYLDDGSESLRFRPKTGFALVHRHGEDCLLHEGAKVLEGCKYLMRTDAMYSIEME